MTLSITSNFDAGAIEVLSCEQADNIRLRVRPDSHADFAQWFYFRLTGAASSFGLTDLKYSVDAQLTSTREAPGLCSSCRLRACVMRSPQNAYRSLPRLFSKRVPISSR